MVLFPIAIQGRPNDAVVAHLKMVYNQCYLDSPTFLHQVAVSKNGMLSCTKTEMRKTAKKFLLEMLTTVSHNFPVCRQVLILKVTASMEDPSNIMELLQTGSSNVNQVCQTTLDMVVKFLMDERKRFGRQAKKHVSKLKLPQAREWQFNWAQENSNVQLKKECQDLLNLQRGFAGFTHSDEARRQKLYGDQACNMTHEKAGTPPTTATLAFIKEECHQLW